jgi:hypothetical protein
MTAIGRHHRIGVGSRRILDDLAKPGCIPALEAFGIQSRSDIGSHGRTRSFGDLVAGNAVALVRAHEKIPAFARLCRNGAWRDGSAHGKKESK